MPKEARDANHGVRWARQFDQRRAARQRIALSSTPFAFAVRYVADAWTEGDPIYSVAR